MNAITFLITLLFLMTCFLTILKLRLCKNPVWYKVGFAVVGWFLFLFIMIESMIYMDQIIDYKTLDKYNNIVNNIREEERLSKTVLEFVMSKYPELNDVKIEEIEDEKGIFLNNPHLKTEAVQKVLTDFLRIKANKERVEEKNCHNKKTDRVSD
ncbi:MAG: hypothetical protein SCARUB_01956 [Candidatus Scalindua rubra]|uniref:Uncharacterized protein n=1 Tax=Candidatus Scalindua rubra TaxID=1872076 RepID=A0A1E3XD60_9BACT|nr:MAG: hypothetical protein SCARUB_01956 [Candidatus Scalindua rubra]